MEDGQRKLGRGANTRTESKQKNKAGQPLLRAGAGAGKTGAGGMKLWGLPGGIRDGEGLPLRLLPVPPAAPPWSRLLEPPSWSALISGHSAGSLGKEVTGEGRPEWQQEGED